MNYTSKLLAVLATAVTLLGMSGCGSAEQRKARYIEKGEALLAQDNVEKARLEFRNALQIDPKDAQAHYQSGRAAERLGDPKQAVAHYQAAIDNDSKHLIARAALGRLFLLGGAPDRALQIVEAGLAQDSKNAQLLTVRAAGRAQRGDMPGAFEDAEAAAAAAPDDEYAIALLASLYRQNARSDKAIEIINNGLKHLPDSVDLRVILAELELGNQHPELAETQLKKVVELKPTDITHRYRLVRFYLMQKNAAAAEATLRSALAAMPDNVDLKLKLAQLLVSHSGFDAADAQFKKFVAADPDNGDLKLTQARFYEAHAKPKEAEAAYRHLIREYELKPVGLTARTRLAVQLSENPKTRTEAEQLVETVLKENPRSNDALALRANLAMARGDTLTAITDLRAVLRDQPNAVAVKRTLARAHLKNNETPLAEELLRSAVQANPKDVSVRMDLADLLAQTGRADQARPILEQLASDAPTDIMIRERLFRVQAALKDMDAAARTADELIRLQPKVPLGHFLRGSIWEEKDAFDQAIAEYEQALELRPDAAEPLTALVRVDMSRKQPALAMKRLDDALARNANNVIASNLKAQLLAGRGDLQPAIDEFERAIAKAPQWWVPYRGLAMTYLKSKKNDAALATFERGLKATDTAASLAIDLAAFYERTGRTDDAIRVYEQLVKKEPQSLGAANNLAMLLASYRTDKTSLDRAAELAGKLANATDPAVLNTRGWVKYKRGEFDDAVALLQEAADKAPDSPLMRYHLGMAQLKAGDKGGAARNLATAVASERPFHGQEEARATLAQLTSAG